MIEQDPTLTEWRPGRALTLTETERAYLAGIIDGEGYVGAEVRKFNTARPGSRPAISVALSISNNEQALMNWLGARFHGRVVTSRASDPGWRDTLHFRVNGAGAGVILEAARPYLIIKRQHAELALYLIRSRGHYGPPGCPPDLRRRRFLAAQTLQSLTDRNGRRRIRAADVLAWLDDRPFRGLRRAS